MSAGLNAAMASIGQSLDPNRMAQTIQMYHQAEEQRKVKETIQSAYSEMKSEAQRDPSFGALVSSYEKINPMFNPDNPKEFGRGRLILHSARNARSALNEASGLLPEFLVKSYESQLLTDPEAVTRSVRQYMLGLEADEKSKIRRDEAWAYQENKEAERRKYNEMLQKEMTADSRAYQEKKSAEREAEKLIASFEAEDKKFDEIQKQRENLVSDIAFLREEGIADSKMLNFLEKAVYRDGANLAGIAQQIDAHITDARRANLESTRAERDERLNAEKHKQTIALLRMMPNVNQEEVDMLEKGAELNPQGNFGLAQNLYYQLSKGLSSATTSSESKAGGKTGTRSGGKSLSAAQTQAQTVDLLLAEDMLETPQVAMFIMENPDAKPLEIASVVMSAMEKKINENNDGDKIKATDVIPLRDMAMAVMFKQKNQGNAAKTSAQKMDANRTAIEIMTANGLIVNDYKGAELFTPTVLGAKVNLPGNPKSLGGAVHYGFDISLETGEANITAQSGPVRMAPDPNDQTKMVHMSPRGTVIPENLALQNTYSGSGLPEGATLSDVKSSLNAREDQIKDFNSYISKLVGGKKVYDEYDEFAPSPSKTAPLSFYYEHDLSKYKRDKIRDLRIELGGRIHRLYDNKRPGTLTRMYRWMTGNPDIEVGSYEKGRTKLAYMDLYYNAAKIKLAAILTEPEPNEHTNP